MILRKPAAKRVSFFRIISAATMVCMVTVLSYGQGIIGLVAEQFSHQPIALAEIIITLGDSIIYSTTSDDFGRYSWRNERAGRYDINITSSDFISYRAAGIILDGYSTLQMQHLLQKKSFDLNEVTVVADEREYPSFVRTITPDDIIQYAGNFEDPVRIAHSQPGVVLLNDQANQLSARGQAPIFNSWYLEGLEVVNPNHTSNAGTISDLPTQYGGGVNMFSAQTLGSTDLYMGVNPLSIGSNIGAVVDMHLHESAKPEWRAKAGLLGLELGGGAALGKKSILDVNLRYSFTGLLTSLGADFGGEKINYYDGIISYRHEGTSHKLKLFTWAGRSINEFDHVEPPEEREQQKDFFDIDYENLILGAGARYDVNLSPSFYLRSGFAYSTNEASHTRTGSVTGTPLTFVREVDVSVTSAFVESSILHSSRVQSIGGIDFTNKVYGIENDPGDGITVRPYLTTSLQMAPKWKLALGGELQYTTRNQEWIPGYRAQLDWNISAQNKLYTGIRHSANKPFSAIDLSRSVHVLSTTYELGWAYGWKNQHLGINVYYQQMNRLQAYYLSVDPEYVYEYFADYPNAYPGTFGSRVDGISRHRGIEGRWNMKTENGWGFNLNQSFYHSVRGLQDSTLTTGRYNGKYATHIAISKEIIQPSNSKNKIWNFALRGILNGGLWEPDIDQTGPPFSFYEFPVLYENQIPDYIRIDAGISRTIAFDKIRWRYALDIQNVLGLTNVAYHYYDHFLMELVTQNQLGIIPVLSVQASW
jgi:hypothetical protein